MAYNSWADGYERALQCKANRYDPDVSIRSEHIGNWIVSAKILGGWHCVICIYNANTLMEHYKTASLAPCDEEDPQDIKNFNQSAFNRNFQRVIELAETWK